MNKFYHEITPLNNSDCFMVFDRYKSKFDFPIHYHEEYELTFIENGNRAKRIVGDSIEYIGQYDLILIGSNLPHGWIDSPKSDVLIHEITIQFHKDFMDEKFLGRNQLSLMKSMLEYSSRGLKFSEETIKCLKPRLTDLSSKAGFDSVLELISILNILSQSTEMKMLVSSSFVKEQIPWKSRRIEVAFDFMRSNFDQNISLKDVSEKVNMAEVSFSRFIKKRTGFTFIDSLNNIRLGQASRMLIETTMNVAEVSFKCGFNNLSYFNRTFKKKYSCTPKEFRENYSGTKVFV